MTNPQHYETHRPPHLSGVSEIAELYDAFILDLWGVVHNGVRAYDGVAECLSELKARGKGICLLSNSPNRAGDVADMIRGFGITEDHYTHLVTSGELTNILFQESEGVFGELEHNDHYYDFWPDTPVRTLEGLGFTQSADMKDCGFILAALLDNFDPDRNAAESYDDELKQALDLGLPMICANPDLKVHHGEREHLCPGTLAHKYELMGGAVIWIGKPYGRAYAHAHHLLGEPDKKRMLAIGDSVRTDIHGAHDFGIDSALNLIGLHWEEVVSIENPKQVDLSKIDAMLATKPYTPTYTIETLKW